MGGGVTAWKKGAREDEGFCGFTLRRMVSSAFALLIIDILLTTARYRFLFNAGVGSRDDTGDQVCLQISGLNLVLQLQLLCHLLSSA